MKPYDLKGKKSIVSGGASGIGRAICETFGSLGADVAIFDVKTEEAQRTAEGLKALGVNALSLPVDITDETKVQEGVEKALAEFGEIDILVNNAGWDRIIPFMETDLGFWEKIVKINYLGPVICTKAVLGVMIRQEEGRIINIASDAGRVGSSGEAVYSGTKGGIIAFTKSIARETARYGITANCISPGPPKTPMLDEMMKEERGKKILEAIERSIPLRRFAQPEDIAYAAAFFAMDGSRYITGQVLSVSGGLSMSD
jgi:2-hydroxycyclohexanecarboxyl-CoA dehydrogenase